MRSVDESEIGSAKVLPPEELRLSWWQNLFFCRRKVSRLSARGAARLARRPVALATSFSRCASARNRQSRFLGGRSCRG